VTFTFTINIPSVGWSEEMFLPTNQTIDSTFQRVWYKKEEEVKL
jgi:hypothetical protein